jgi:hypothetical protein
LTTRENDSITRHALTFLRETDISTPATDDAIRKIALDPTRNTGLRTTPSNACQNIPSENGHAAHPRKRPRPARRGQAFRRLIKRQHRATISRALATLTDDELRAGETPIPENSTLDWIGNVTEAFALDEESLAVEFEFCAARGEAEQESNV